jgi:RHS repeat-associated protein
MSNCSLVSDAVTSGPSPNNRLSDPSITYDASGNQLVTYNGGTAVALTWDAEGRLASSTPAGGTTTTYGYGADGQRATKTVGGVFTTYVRDFDGSLLTTTNNGDYQGQNEEVWVGGKHFGTFTVSGSTITKSLSLTNWLGSEAARTDPGTGIPTSGYVSQPFGDLQTTVFGSDSDPLHFTGKERDAESGNDYFGARYYASSMGRFLSPDWSAQEEPVPYAHLDDPQSLNLYSYVRNNPLNKVDPNGHCPWCLAAAGGGILADEAPLALTGPVGWTIIGVTAVGVVGVAIYENMHQSAAHPSIPYPGNNPATPPNGDVEWRGKGDPASGKGSWVNPKTGEVYHPDVNHPLPVGKHWDYTDPNGKQWRVFPDGHVEPKPEPKPKPQPNPTPNPTPTPTPNPTPNPTPQPNPTPEPNPTPKQGI